MKLSLSWSWRRPLTLEAVIFECLSSEEAARLMRLPLIGLDATAPEQRTALFATAVGIAKATMVNEQLEAKVLLPNQKMGLLRWLKAERDVNPKSRKEIRREIDSLDRFLYGRDLERFMERLAELRSGSGVTFAEAAEITRLSRGVQLAKDSMEAGRGAEEYQAAQRAFHAYVEKLKAES